jgi:hypothetical protein
MKRWHNKLLIKYKQFSLLCLSLLRRIRTTLICYNSLSMSITPRSIVHHVGSLFSVVLSSRRLRAIAEDRCLLPDHKFPELFNSAEKKYTLSSLEAKVDSAIQVLYVSLIHDCGMIIV